MSSPRHYAPSQIILVFVFVFVRHLSPCREVFLKDLIFDRERDSINEESTAAGNAVADPF